ncbi:MAG: deoxyribodipyrimidine photo-lyase [Bacteroidales bacterium]|nr:deoxyribodipyrimidine photo-lyase [Bacteroidales bacterium]
MEKVTFVWLRRDLRLNDNQALYRALKERQAVLPLFIFDSQILDELEDSGDARITFIYDTLLDLRKQLQEIGSSLLVRYGEPVEVFRELLRFYPMHGVFFNRDYEPYATGRDQQVQELLQGHGVEVRTFKDQVIFEGNEVLKQDGKPYTVYTPYMRKWKQVFGDTPLKFFEAENYTDAYYRTSPMDMPSLASMGFQRSDRAFPSSKMDESVIQNYHLWRDYPAVEGTTRLGMHLRFGTLSIRQAIAKAVELNETWLNELIWRDFYMMILWHFPRVVDQSFKPAYDEIEWRDDEADFQAWASGQTGYPLVDAGMRELNETGYMHNRVRMVTASFLTKHLLIDWRWGESYFAGQLLDYELSSNNGGWQWAAGSGCDAAPYFRIFNPMRQAQRFDPEGAYIRKWVPEFLSGNYRNPIVDHKFARERALDTYRKALKK